MHFLRRSRRRRSAHGDGQSGAKFPFILEDRLEEKQDQKVTESTGTPGTP
jgi:hypothetical protein